MSRSLDPLERDSISCRDGKVYHGKHITPFWDIWREHDSARFSDDHRKYFYLLPTAILRWLHSVKREIVLMRGREAKKVRRAMKKEKIVYAYCVKEKKSGILLFMGRAI